MTRALIPALALALLAAPAAAQDSRLVEVMYDEARVVRVEGRVTVQASILFGDDEVIENVAIGDSASWQVTPNKRANILFVKPLEPRASTNLTVITSKRTYLFDLVANPNAKPLYLMRFAYPDEPEEEQDVQMAAGPNSLEAQAARDPYAVVDPADLNFAWNASGAPELLPENTYDDGTATFLTWPNGKDVPAILVTNSEGVEGPVNFTVRGDTIVVDGVPRTIVLRSGKDSAQLVNTGPERPATSASGKPALASKGR
ncbi:MULTISPECIES: TrbG/VirB9 family P-type conjugative transfer protein [Erythrobacter]|jgi:type IV secretion system protein VirB9|uniref:Type VI secretion protein n=1 Tax=Erythrobacter aureus TaxID=2182384 RepID=A0A345YGY3_9SPHN|nr:MULTISPECIES: TrbG/VirB9 family P-type conjugative transfer protein [Erythrobacter]AXK43185.1 type VI secretion protein [Erythrobacter aureus]MBQ95452.1 type VI secretion protein [Actinomycetota bacterium]MCF8883887.1 TrbG/VirB9 family P-type conjugative transfer protein [Erythrobacter sp. SN021]